VGDYVFSKTFTGQFLRLEIICRVPNPHGFNADPDPDPATQINADPCGSGSETLIYVKLGFVGFRLLNHYKIVLYCTILYYNVLITSSGRTRSLFIALLSSRVLPKKLNKKITSLIIY
jgi:hypothetical protein